MRHWLVRVVFGVAMGALASVLLVFIVGAALAGGKPRNRLVPEDASGHLRRIAIHYAPAMDARAMPVWRELFRVLPADIAVEVAVARREDFDRFLAKMRAGGSPAGFAGRGAKPGDDIADRFRAVIVGQQITTWSRDRMAALATPSGGGVLAPPRVATASGARAGDWEAPFALAREVYNARPQVAELVFEGGDLAASKHHVFADANLIGRNLGRGDATRPYLEGILERTFDQDIVWLGDAQGDVPEHHIMMYMVPLDDREVLVGDVRRGRALAPDLEADEDFELHAARFDRVAALLAARGFTVRRVPVVVLPGAGSYVTYTNALFDRDARGPVVYLPTYSQPALDREATLLYESLGYRVIPIDVTSIYRLNGSLGCLVNVMARD